MSTINQSKLSAITPNALEIYRSAFLYCGAILDAFAISANALRVEHFLAQMLEETGGLTLLAENLNYSARRLMVVWPTRFPTLESTQDFKGNPVALANKVYGGRMGNTTPGDGWKYIGRGLLQITGREEYRDIGAMLGIDLVANPNLVLLPEYNLRVAASIWDKEGCNTMADLDSLARVTKAINGGYIGIASRKAWLAKVRSSGVVETSA